ncbi:MAG: MMPL family transporter [Salibacteraceae bacterium]
MSRSLAKIIIAFVAIVTLAAGYNISKLQFDYEFEHFFPSEDPMLDFYNSYKEKFYTDVDFVLLALRNDQGIFDQAFLERALSLQNDLKSISKIKRVISPFTFRSYALGPFGPIGIPLLHPSEPNRYKADSTKIFKHDKEVGSLFSKDGKSISMLIEVEPNLSKLQTDTAFLHLSEVVDRYTFDEIHLAGKAIGQAYYIEQIQYEFALFFSLAVLLVIIILTLVYRSFWGVVVPLAIVFLSVIWLLGLMGVVGKNIDIMTVLLPLILFVVGISDVIHLLSRFFEEIRNGHPKFAAIKVAYRQVGLATFLTSFTTALGFLTLISSGIKPVRELGVFAAIGVFIAFVLAFSVLPAILTLNPVPKLAYKEPSKLFWNKLVRRFFFISLRYHKPIIGLTVVLVGLSVFGISKVEVNNYLLEDVGKDDPMRYSFEYFENNFAGARPFELYIEVTDSNATIFDQSSVNDMLNIESYLNEKYGVGFLISPLNVLRTANQALNGGLESAYTVPTDAQNLERVKSIVRKIENRPEFTSIMTQDRRSARFSGKMKDRGGKQTKLLNEELSQYFNQNPLESLRFELTGMALLIDQNNETLSRDMLSGLLLALFVVACIVGLMFRSFKMALISLVPNIIPLLTVAGVMGFFGIDLKVATSVIFGIAFGIAVDDSIHYLSKFRLEKGKNRSDIWALRRTSISTGKAILLTSLILCAGFATLIASDFTSTFYVGLLVSITLFTAVLADLFLLPALIYLFKKRGAR